MILLFECCLFLVVVENWELISLFYNLSVLILLKHHRNFVQPSTARYAEMGKETTLCYSIPLPSHFFYYRFLFEVKGSRNVARIRDLSKFGLSTLGPVPSDDL